MIKCTMLEFHGVAVEGQYKNKPLRSFHGQLKDASGTSPIPFEVAIHPNPSRRVIINMPGANGVIDGYADKYKILGHHIQSANLAAFVRTDNIFVEGHLPDVKLRAALQYTREHAWEICGNPNPEVTTMLLFAPSGNMPGTTIRRGMENFQGEVYIVQGEQDEVVGPQAGRFFYDLASGVSRKELFMIPDCDHQFRGEKNGRIISEGPFYAFSTGTKPTFPDPTGGIKLYD